MKIGYACLAVGVPGTQQSTCRQKNATNEVLEDLIRHNLRALDRIIDYNIKKNILLFRISSDIIPFGSSPVNELPWAAMFKKEFEEIGQKIKKSGMRVSMHPGQYTVLNSNDVGVVERAVDDLNYHALVLDSMDLDQSHKLILHIGGVYGNRQNAIARFKLNYQQLGERVKRRLVIENDDKSYGIEEVLEIGNSQGIPVVFDNLHHAVKPSPGPYTQREWINACNTTWKREDGMQKMHYSQQNSEKKAGSHSEFIKIDEFIDFFNTLKRDDIHIMLEVKDKNLSAVKCINCTNPKGKRKDLELEWSRYKYAVLEKSQEHYDKIRLLLSAQELCTPVAFYQLIEEALCRTVVLGGAINAAQHVWGYFKKDVTEKEKQQFFRLMEKAEADVAIFRSVKKFLWRLVLKYEQPYLLYSYYFFL